MFSDDYCSGVQICGESKKVHLPEGQNNCFSLDCFERQAVQHKQHLCLIAYTYDTTNWYRRYYENLKCQFLVGIYATRSGKENKEKRFAKHTAHTIKGPKVLRSSILV